MAGRGAALSETAALAARGWLWLGKPLVALLGKGQLAPSSFGGLAWHWGGDRDFPTWLQFCGESGACQEGFGGEGRGGWEGGGEWGLSFYSSLGEILKNDPCRLP